MSALIERTGHVYGRLVVVSQAPNRGREPCWNCECGCGNTKVVTSRSLKKGDCKSCGCLDREHRKFGNVKHGMASRRSGIYQSWADAIQRCTNPNIKAYPNYGGRGISVCERWMTFENFLEDMEAGWYKGMTLDRIDRNGNYEPGNCQWLTRSAHASKDNRGRR